MLFMSALAKLPAYPMHVTNLTASPILEYLTVSEIIIRIFSGLKKNINETKMPFFSCQKGDKIPLWSWGNRVDLARGHESALPWWDRCGKSLSPVLVIFGHPGDSNEGFVFIITRCYFSVASILVGCNVARKRHGHCQKYQPSLHHVFFLFSRLLI